MLERFWFVVPKYNRFEVLTFNIAGIPPVIACYQPLAAKDNESTLNQKRTSDLRLI